MQLYDVRKKYDKKNINPKEIKLFRNFSVQFPIIDQSYDKIVQFST